MMDTNIAKNNEARRALINIVTLEGFLLIAVVIVYVYTDNLVYFVGGVMGAMFISVPMIVRWLMRYGKVKDASHSRESGDDGTIR